MEIVEIILLILAYSLTILVLFLEFIGYKKNIENKETIGLTVSLFLLIIALTLTHFTKNIYSLEFTDIFVLVAMVLVALFTPLNVIKERQYKIHSRYKKVVIWTSALLLIGLIPAYIFDVLFLMEYVISIYLGLSIVLSMVLIRTTKPHVIVKHREKIDRFIALAFLITLPLILATSYITQLQSIQTKIGFTLPLVFIILLGSKLWDDLIRLSLIKNKHSINEQSMLNYALTKREKEVAQLLIKGLTYKQISEQLFISLPTVKTHASNIYKKCKINNRIELISLLSNT